MYKNLKVLSDTLCSDEYDPSSISLTIFAVE